MSDSSIPPFSGVEAWALRRALAGKSWREAPALSPLVSMVAERLENMRDLNLIAPFFNPAALAQIMGVDPVSAPPAVPGLSTDSDALAPDLPQTCRLTPAQEREASEAGQWERQYSAWAGATANETPLLFHQAAALVIGATAIGRRLYVATGFGEDIYPNLYLMVVAISTYYRKSTSLRLAERFIRRTMPHMLLPDPGSAENFNAMVAGDESLMEKMQQGDKTRYGRGLLNFPGQRLLIRDELSGMFRANASKDYMAGMKENWLKFYDGIDESPLSSMGRGNVIVRDVSLSLFGTTTPDSLGYSITHADWGDGNMARFALITPEPDYRDRPALDTPLSHADLDRVIHDLHNRLPEPPRFNALGDRPKAESWSLVVKPYQHFRAYSNALRTLTAPGSAIDDRLRGWYGRHAVRALKIAIILAGLDWISEKSGAAPIIEDRHWFRAQQIAEDWRASAHRCLKQLSTSEYSEAEQKIRTQLAAYPTGITKSTLLKRTNLRAKAIDEVMSYLIEGGEVEMLREKVGGAGRDRAVYRWAS